jgi:hypothetical protein
MDTKPDGRLYSRVTRRCAVIIRHLRAGRVFTVNDVAAEIHGRTLSDFYVSRFDRQMSVPRTRAYIRFLIDLGAIVETEGGYARDFAHRTSDADWAQALSDLALRHLARLLGQPPEETPAFLEARLADFFDRRQLPTLDGLADELGIARGRARELFKWTVYMYTDGGACPFDIRSFPVVLGRGGTAEGE